MVEQELKNNVPICAGVLLNHHLLLTESDVSAWAAHCASECIDHMWLQDICGCKSLSITAHKCCIMQHQETAILSQPKQHNWLYNEKCSTGYYIEKQDNWLCTDHLPVQVSHHFTSCLLHTVCVIMGYTMYFWVH